MAEASKLTAQDWAGSMRAYSMAWGIPSLAVIAGSVFDPPSRTVIWVLALIWMGTACLINARRCGRMHCHFTGPFYLILMIPVILQGIGMLPLGPYGWWILGATILLGGKVIWWASEAALGKFSTPQ